MGEPKPEQTKPGKAANPERHNKSDQSGPHPDGPVGEALASLPKFNDAKNAFTKNVDMTPFDGKDKKTPVITESNKFAAPLPDQNKKDEYRRQLTNELDGLRKDDLNNNGDGDTSQVAAKHAQLANSYRQGNPTDAEKSQAEYHLLEVIRIGEKTKIDPTILVDAYKRTAQEYLQSNHSPQNTHQAAEYLGKALAITQDDLNENNPQNRLDYVHTLELKGKAYQACGSMEDHAEAVLSYRRAEELREQYHLPTDVSYLQTQLAQNDSLDQIRGPSLPDQLKSYEKVLQAAEKMYGENEQLFPYLDNFTKLGNSAIVREKLEKALKIAEQSPNADAYGIATRHDQLARLYGSAAAKAVGAADSLDLEVELGLNTDDKTKEIIDHEQQSNTLARQAHHHEDKALSIWQTPLKEGGENKGDDLVKQGAGGKAQELYTQAIKEREAELQKLTTNNAQPTPRTALLHESLGNLYLKLDRNNANLDQSEAHFKKSLDDSNKYFEQQSLGSRYHYLGTHADKQDAPDPYARLKYEQHGAMVGLLACAEQPVPGQRITVRDNDLLGEHLPVATRKPLFKAVELAEQIVALDRRALTQAVPVNKQLSADLEHVGNLHARSADNERKMSRLVHHPRGMGDAYAAFQNQYYRKAINALKESANIDRQLNVEDTATAEKLMRCGDLAHISDYAEVTAGKFFQQALSIQEKIPDADLLRALDGISRYGSNLPERINASKRALSIEKTKPGHEWTVPTRLDDLGQLYQANEQFREAENAFKENLTAGENENKANQTTAGALHSLAQLAKEERKGDLELSYRQRYLEIEQKLPSVLSNYKLDMALWELGKTQAEQGKHNQAIATFQKALDVQKTLPAGHDIDTLDRLSSLHENMGDRDKAMDYAEQAWSVWSQHKGLYYDTDRISPKYGRDLQTRQARMVDLYTKYGTPAAKERLKRLEKEVQRLQDDPLIPKNPAELKILDSPRFIRV